MFSNLFFMLFIDVHVVRSGSILFVAVLCCPICFDVIYRRLNVVRTMPMLFIEVYVVQTVFILFIEVYVF